MMRAMPEWVADAVFYQIFPDRFARSGRVHVPGPLEAWDAPPTQHGYKGGDLFGVVERLDHLEALGVNALYLTPIFQSASNHRYHTHDYFTVDPMLGGDAAFDALIEADKDVDMLLIPGAEHALIGRMHYAKRRTWDYFVRHLHGTEPPAYSLAPLPLPPALA